MLLYGESLTTSLRETRANLRGIAPLSAALVVRTAWARCGRACARAAVGSSVGAGRGDSSHGRDGGRRPGAEPLAPSAHRAAHGEPGQRRTALVIYGVTVAWVNMNLRRRLDDLLLGNPVMILAPFTAYLLAELVNASGVLAVVISGLIMTHAAPLDRCPRQRLPRISHRARIVRGPARFRSFIVLVTAGVIVVTLVAQGLLLSAAVRWAKLPASGARGRAWRDSHPGARGDGQPGQ